MEELKVIIQSVFQYGGTVIMAGLFIWVFVTDKTKNNKLEEENNQMLKLLTDNQKNIAESNNNIAKSLEIISNNQKQISDNLSSVDVKIDRNYEKLIERK